VVWLACGFFRFRFRFPVLLSFFLYLWVVSSRTALNTGDRDIYSDRNLSDMVEKTLY